MPLQIDGSEEGAPRRHRGTKRPKISVVPLPAGLALAGSLLLAALGTETLGAQEPCFQGSVDYDGPCYFDAPRWVGEFASLSANGLIGALTGGLSQHLGGGSFRDGFVEGALGGSIVYAGKRTAAESFAGAGFLGRSMAAVGASSVRNVSRGDPLFSRLTLPLGPLWVEFDTPTRELSARLDPVALGWMAYGISEPELELDWGATFSNGAPVFKTHNKVLKLGGDTIHVAGVTNAGIVYSADVPAYGPGHARRHRAHEQVHVIQEDQLAIMWTDPLGRWAMGRAARLRRLRSRLAVNLSTEILRLLGHAVPEHGDRPWEVESVFFAR